MKERNKYASQLADREGISYQEAYNEMKTFRQMTGVSFADYYKKDLHNMEEHIRFREAEKISARKERRKNNLKDITDAAGLTSAEIQENITGLNDIMNGRLRVSLAMYHDYELYSKSQEEVKEVLDRLAAREELSSRFRSIFSVSGIDGSRIGELEGIYNDIIELITPVVTQTMLDKYREEFSYRYPGVAADDALCREIIADYLTLARTTGHTRTDYKLYDLRNRSFRDKLKYVSGREMESTIREVNRPQVKALMDDKYRCYEKFRQYYGRDIVLVRGAEDLDAFREFCSQRTHFVKKPCFSRQGSGIRKVTVSDYSSVDEMLDSVLSEDGMFIAEELVRGHWSTSRFNADSLNTLRLVTFNTGNRSVRIDETGEAFISGAVRYIGEGVYCCTPFFKTGRTGSFVDNAGAGGVFSAVDLRSGRGSAAAVSEDGISYSAHPDSGVKFTRLRIRKLSKALETVRELALMIPDAGIIGWDLAYTNKRRWVLIEGNYAPTVIGQAPAECGILTEFRQITQLMDHIEEMPAKEESAARKTSTARESCIADVMAETGLSREEVTEMISRTRKTLGITYTNYVKYGFCRIPPEEQISAYKKLIMKDLIRVRNRPAYYIDAVFSGIEQNGWTYREAEDDVNSALENYGLTCKEYYVNGFCRTAGSDRDELAQKTIGQRELAEAEKTERKAREAAREEQCLNDVIRETGWSRETAIQHMDEAMRSNGAVYHDYSMYRFWELDEQEQEEYFTYQSAVALRDKYNKGKRHLRLMTSHKDIFCGVFDKYLGRKWVSTIGLSWESFRNVFADEEKVIYKPRAGAGGYDVEVFTNRSEDDLRQIYETVIRRPFGIVESYIEQHRLMKQYSSESVNTVRIVTVRTKDPSHGIETDKVHFIYSAMRMGGTSGFTDNLHSGGMVAAADIETGELVTDAAGYDGKVYTHHPATGAAIRGFVIPYFTEAKDMIRSAMEEMDIEGYMGWDIAITDGGPVIVEVNNNPGQGLLQIPYSPQRKGMKYLMDRY